MKFLKASFKYKVHRFSKIITQIFLSLLDVKKIGPLLTILNTLSSLPNHRLLNARANKYMKEVTLACK